MKKERKKNETEKTDPYWQRARTHAHTHTQKERERERERELTNKQGERKG